MQSQTPLGPTPDLSEGQLKVVGKVAQPWGPGVGGKGTGGQEAGSQPHNSPLPSLSLFHLVWPFHLQLISCFLTVSSLSFPVPVHRLLKSSFPGVSGVHPFLSRF